MILNMNAQRNGPIVSESQKMLGYLLVFIQCAVLNDVIPSWSIVPRHLLYSEEVFPCCSRDTHCCTKQQHSL